MSGRAIARQVSISTSKFASYGDNDAIASKQRWHAALRSYLLTLIAALLLLPGLAAAQTNIAGGATVNLALTTGQFFSQSFIGSGTVSNTYQVVGALPPGLSAAIGPAPPPASTNFVLTLSGSATVAGTYNFNVNVTAVGAAATLTYTTPFSVVVSPALVPPVTNPQNVTVQANSANNPITPDVSGTFSSLALSGTPAHGTASVNGLALSYTPTANYVGNDTLSYTASGPGGTSAPATISITVIAAPPTVSPAALVVAADTAGSIDLATVVSGPTFTGINIAITAAPTHGVASLNGTRLTYTPARGFVGADALSFIATAVGGTSRAAILSITVTARPDPSRDAGVVAMQAAGAAAVRHFERAQLDNFNGRLAELASSSTPDTADSSGKKECGSISVWGAGLNNSGSYGGDSGFKFDHSGLSVGGDRCFGSGTVLGLGFGYGRDRSEVNLDGSAMAAHAGTAATYGSVQLLPRLRVSWVAGVNQIDSKYDRYVAVGNTFAHGQWSGNQWLSSGSASTDLQFGQWHIAPFGRIDISKLTLDPYAESGGGPNALRYQGQTMASRRTSLGFDGDTTITTSFGKVIPRLHLEYQHDFANRDAVMVSYADMPDGGSYAIAANELDRSILLAAVGADLIWRNGLIVALNYSYSSANEGNTANSLQLRLSYRF
ncbi:MAG: autotransporter domain-containing protein [Pseudomonadota bacterium]